MTTRSALAGCLLLAIAGSVSAQSAPLQVSGPKLEGKTPAECIKGANDWRNLQMRPLSTALRNNTLDGPGYSAAYAAITKESQRIAKECGAQFSVERSSSGDLPGLAQLASFVGDTINTRRAIEKALAATDLSPRQLGQALTLAMSQEVSRLPSHFGIIEAAERYIARIDALPDSLSDLKITAHQSMLGRYEYLDVAEGLAKHSTAVLELARKLGKPEYMASAYLSLARSFADRLNPDSALMILDRAEKELAATPRVAETFKGFRDRYALIGTRAAAIPGKWWLNPQGTSAPLQPGNGRVTFIEFTAHWCGPCKNSYPGVKTMAERFTDQPFDVIMVTSLYGYVGDQKNLTPEQEVAADVVYFTRKEGLPFRVAINESRKSPTGQTIGLPEIDESYRVGGIPQIIIVDKRGVIRQIVTGWDQGNTERIGRYVAQLLRESETTQ